MLVLSAKQGESFIITAGNDIIKVTVTASNMVGAKIGFTCKKDIIVDREKIHIIKMKEKDNAK